MENNDEEVNESLSKIIVRKKAKVDDKTKKFNHDTNGSDSMKAIKYVAQLRQLDRDQQAKQKSLQRLDKESEIQQIGQSWESRLAQVIKQPSQKRSKERFSIGEDRDDDVPSYNPTLQVNDKFLPPDLTKLSSVQVIEMLKESVIFDKSDILILSKPHGLEMFNSKRHHHSLEKYLPHLADFSGCSTLYQVHRLDKMTSGILVLAKSQSRHDYLCKMFKQRLIQKNYWAIVNGTPHPAEGIINIPLCETQFGDRYR